MKIRLPYPYVTGRWSQKLSIEMNEESGRVTVTAKEYRHNEYVMRTVDAIIIANKQKLHCCGAPARGWTPTEQHETVTILFEEYPESVGPVVLGGDAD